MYIKTAPVQMHHLVDCQEEVKQVKKNVWLIFGNKHFDKQLNYSILMALKFT